jgi:hypothetical protein
MQLYKSRKKVLSPVLLLLSAFFVVLLTACGGTVTGNTGNSGITLPTSTTSSVDLKHSPVGTTDLQWKADTQKLTVKISLTGLAPGSSHAAHVHAGNCAVDGAIVYPLSPLVADAKGDATSVTTIPNVQNGIPATGWYINVHNGLGMTQIEHMPISCANIVIGSPLKINGHVVTDNNGHAVTCQKTDCPVAMNGTNAPNESVTGHAQLIIVKGKLALQLTLFHLLPLSTHVAHIHWGTCEAQGPVLVTLSSVVADRNGDGISVTSYDQIDHQINHHIDQTTARQIVSSLLSASPNVYINVHWGATMAQLSQSVFFNPIACSLPPSN